MTQAICDITTDEVNVDVVVEPQADTMVEVANRAGGMEQVFHDNTLIGNGNSVDLGVNTDIIATKEYSDEQDILLRNEINGKLTAIDSQIDANADAIQKTREDFASADQSIRDDMNAEDSRLQTQITAQAAAITTNKNDIDELGDQVSEIESKIPESASTTNPLITESDLQKIDLGNYVKKSGDEMSGELVVAPENPNASTRQITFVGKMGVDGRVVPAELKLGNGPTFEGDFYVEGNPNGGFVITNSKIVLSPSPQYTGITRRLGEKDYKFDITYTKTLNNGEEIQVPTVGGTMARIEDLAELRADVNLTDSELQTQITAQAAAIATLDSEKLDKNQGNINAGKYLIVGNDGNIELTTSGGGGGGGIGSVNHDETLTGNGTDDFPLGLADAIKDEIADKAPKETVEALTQVINGIIGDYVKKSGDSMTGGLTLPELTVRTAEGEFYVSVVAGVVTIATNNGLDFASHVKFDTAPTTDDNTTYANALDTSLVCKAQVATAISDAMANVDALPSQSGNEGKVLSTNGSEAEWTEMPGLIIRRL